jgi:predicted RNase H-like nuclease (RuvC/YqgF family)
MPHYSTLEIIIFCFTAAALLLIGYRIGRWIGALAASRMITARDQEHFTSQKGFKQLYEQEVAQLKEKNAQLQVQIETLTARTEEYRKKAAGLGGLFSSGGKRADAMYALLLENEALEEALHNQNKKLSQEHADSLKEQLRATGYRRVLMSQLLNDERIKGYVAEVLNDDKRLPPPSDNANANSQ